MAKRRPVQGDADNSMGRLQRLHLPLVAEEMRRGEGLAAVGAAEEARTVRSGEEAEFLRRAEELEALGCHGRSNSLLRQRERAL